MAAAGLFIQGVSVNGLLEESIRKIQNKAHCVAAPCGRCNLNGQRREWGPFCRSRFHLAMMNSSLWHRRLVTHTEDHARPAEGFSCRYRLLIAGSLPSGASCQRWRTWHGQRCHAGGGYRSLGAGPSHSAENKRLSCNRLAELFSMPLPPQASSAYFFSNALVSGPQFPDCWFHFWFLEKKL